MEKCEIFLREIPYKVLLEIDRIEEQHGVYTLSRRIKMTYSHLVHMMQHFKINGLVTIEKKGRTNIIRITEKGKEVATNLRKILALMGEMK